MTIEFITKRIEGKKAAISKLEKKLARIEAAKATLWTKNPYYYNDNDLRRTIRDLEEARHALIDLEDALAKEQAKAESRNVPAILEFLENWKARMRVVYKQGFKDYMAAYNEYEALVDDYHEWEYSDEGRAATKEEKKRRYNERWEAWNDLKERFGWVRNYVEYKTFDEKRFEKDIKTEAERKYDFIIERTEAIVTKITDASGLMVGAKGDLNGEIIGTTGTATVKTVGAGGYAIQCFHFRTLIHEKKQAVKAPVEEKKVYDDEKCGIKDTLTGEVDRGWKKWEAEIRIADLEKKDKARGKYTPSRYVIVPQTVEDDDLVGDVRYGYMISWETGHFDRELGERTRQHAFTESKAEAEEIADTKRDIGFLNVVIEKRPIRG